MVDIIIKKSKISGKGVFAGRDYEKGEIVIRWNPKIIEKSKIGELPKKLLSYIDKSGDNYYLMQPPEKYVNHSCQPNTMVKNDCDVAIRGIKKGEEITSDYSGQEFESFECKCGSRKCKKFIN